MNTGRAGVNLEGENSSIQPFYRASRRQWLASAIIFAVGSALSGCYKPKPKADESTESDADNQKLAAFWALRLPAVTAVSGANQVALAAFRGHPLLVNFWATWCPPCVAELPLLNRFYTEHNPHDWQCLGLAVEDQREPVARFLARTPVVYPVALAGLAGVQFSQNLGNTGGGLPFTVLFDAQGLIKHSKIGQLQFSDLNAWLN